MLMLSMYGRLYGGARLPAVGGHLHRAPSIRVWLQDQVTRAGRPVEWAGGSCLGRLCGRWQDDSRQVGLLQSFNQRPTGCSQWKLKGKSVWQGRLVLRAWRPA